MTASYYDRSFALNNLDLKLKEYLDFGRGFFIEAGGNDGIAQSNTLYFEKHWKWKGILIEPIPELAEKCKINRPNCIVENCALVPFDYDKSDIDMYYCNLVSMVKGAQKTEEAELQHIQRGCEVQQIKSYELKVPARTLTSILDQYGVKNIDLLSLDVEGFELNALKGLDFERYQPNFLLIEARFRQEIDDFLAPLYEPIANLSHHDVLYKSKKKIKEENNFQLYTPVVFIIFKRPDVTQAVFNKIAQAKPPKLLVIADGPRSTEEAHLCEETRSIINQVDWECEVLTNYSDNNLGCKKRVSSGLDWVFSEVEEAIILEDDCLPSISFFQFCQTLLNYYRNDERIWLISGNNFQGGQIRTDYSYYFSRYPHNWGWATWRRAWKHFDLEMKFWTQCKELKLLETIFEDPYEQDYWLDILEKTHNNLIDSWAYIWGYTCWINNGLTILPEVNLVSNIGFGEDATHTKDINNPLANISVSNIINIEHPPYLCRHLEADAYSFNHIFGGQQMKQLIKQLQEELNQAHNTIQKLSEENSQTKTQLQNRQTELEQNDIKIKQTQNQLILINSQLQQMQTQLQQAQAQIIAMESSKFWKLRTQWLKLKKKLRLSVK
ncbi:unknown [Crocosphaera subtropica ATCC 51142]|uniref:Methyltransferase FkbM domain-containing protein n=1 Tax=Crocosphaera subtropica (strain ATCC 51142 / BH68) TaxID=43989 RepID=B1WP81_CROS5|nr:FkbM family methyltransferase [Crocosphaera subtropica]ACB49863.1 unknown [Crocosphaera subtropica ATCC 51142]